VGGLQSYVNAAGGYEFLYPNGWIQVDVEDAREGVDVVYRDLIERTENLSVIVSEVPKSKTLTELGTPSEVGYRFLKSVNGSANSKREADLIRAESREASGKTYYILEYEVKLPNQQKRHDIASVAISRGKLLTFNLSAPQQRWQKVKNLFETSVQSFTVY
jgi:photosystem II oxygen-evolving enhancer protein 2